MTTKTPDREERIADLVFQIKRDTEALADPHLCKFDRTFIEERLTEYRAEVLLLRYGQPGDDAFDAFIRKQGREPYDADGRIKRGGDHGTDRRKGRPAR